MKFFYSFLFVLFTSSSFSQWVWDQFTGEERAFFYNISRKTEILKPELFHLFEFTDSIPYVNDTLPNYSYIEKEIVKHPEKLILHTDQITRKSIGLVSDLATAYALWQLDNVLHYRTSVAPEHEKLKEQYSYFEKLVMENIPQTALTTLSSGEYVIRKGIASYFSPNMTIADRMAGIANSGYSLEDQMLILNAISKAQEKFVQEEMAKCLFKLGMFQTPKFDFISATGDGSSWADLLGSFKTPYNHLVPDERGLFHFETEIFTEQETKAEGVVVEKKPVIRAKEIVVKELRMDKEKATILHFDVLGYHPERQTTVAIQKGDKSYILYGKNEHRLISPDSSYGKGSTYWRLMYELEHDYIAQIRENLYGKKGYEYWIKDYEDKIKNTELLIKKTEFRLDELRYTPTGQPKMKKKKIKKKNLDKSDQINGHPTNTLTKHEKKMNIEQNRLIHLNTLWEDQKNKLRALIKEFEEAKFLLIKYEDLLDRMQKNLGYVFMDYKQDGPIYTFDDGTIFNYATQEFIFLPNGREEVFRVYQISFGEKVLSTRIEENFIHINFAYQDLNERFNLRKIEPDNAARNFTASDSIQTMEIFQEILKRKMDVTMIVEAGGIISQQEAVKGNFVRDSNLTAIAYSADNYKNTGFTVYRADKKSTMELRVTCWGEEMMPASMNNYLSSATKFKSKYPDLNEIDFYTGMLAKKKAEQWLIALKNLVPYWFKKQEDQAAILKALNSVKIGKVKFNQGRIEAKVPTLAE